FRYARFLRQRGHKVYFLVPDWSYNEGILQQLVDRGDIDGFSRLTSYYAHGWVNFVSRIFVHPRIRNRVLRYQQQEALRCLQQAMDRWHCDLIMLSSRMYLFAIPDLQRQSAVVVDWGDSFALAWWRTLMLKIRRRELRGFGNAIRMLLAYAADESYYPKLAEATIVVSPVDKQAIDRLCKAPERVYVNPNGISFPDSPPQRQRDPNRIIFTGWMNFPPNYDAALWFLDDVFPLVLSARPSTKFVIAGAEPPPALLDRASSSVEITGAVPDLSSEIACSGLYVAPLVSGGGFKNKVFEAIAAGTYVVGTSIATEFLTPDLRQCTTVADGAVPLAHAILKALADLEALRPAVERAQEILRREHSWEACARRQESIFETAIQSRKSKLSR
ncbi:MAG TPA: glycosyltransferase family 4 protein, partial [Candidatus Angelobacter sp.]|nr:glycosyltransferase family 4 protein [Candidatus Angelobacter sp.]